MGRSTRHARLVVGHAAIESRLRDVMLLPPKALPLLLISVEGITSVAFLFFEQTKTLPPSLLVLPLVDQFPPGAVQFPGPTGHCADEGCNPIDCASYLYTQQGHRHLA